MVQMESIKRLQSEKIFRHVWVWFLGCWVFGGCWGLGVTFGMG
jgi:hypothetical protein